MPVDPPQAWDLDPTTPVRGRGKSILIVDDDAGSRESVRFVLGGHYNIHLAENGRQALDIASRMSIDAVILDILMPGMSGIEVLARLKQLDPRIEVVMLTAFETIETARAAIRLGASDYLGKPFEVANLRRAVAHAVEKRDALQPVRHHDDKLRILQEELHSHQLREEMSRATSDIYASILHDLNSPLTAAAGFLELAQQVLNDSGNIKQSSVYLANVHRHMAQCIDISKRYLGFLQGRTNAGVPASLNQSLGELGELLKVHPSSRLNDLSIYPHASDLTVLINPTDLLQVLLNLTINGLQCSAEPHTVTVRTRTQPVMPDECDLQDSAHTRWLPPAEPVREPLIAITVEDNGPGMMPAVLQNAFQPYFTTKPAGQGTGLGLSIVRRLLAQAGGGLHVFSRQGEGTIFTIYLSVKA